MTPRARQGTPEEIEAAFTQAKVPAPVFNAVQLRGYIGLGTHQLWLSATSLDAAKRLARQALTEDLLNIYHATAPATEDDWNDAAGRIQRMARAIATKLDRVPVEWTGPASGQDNDQIPAMVRQRLNSDNGDQILITAIAAGAIQAGELVRFKRTEDPIPHTFIRGWSVDNLTEERGGMLAIEAELLDVLGATQPTNGSASDKAAKDAVSGYRQLAEERWAAFQTHGAIEPTEGLEGVSSYGIEEADAHALHELWSRYIPDTSEQPAKTLALVAIFAWLDVLGERDRDARRVQMFVHKHPAPAVSIAFTQLMTSEISGSDLRRPKRDVIGVPLEVAQTLQGQVRPEFMVLMARYIAEQSHANVMAGGNGEFVFVPSGQKAMMALGFPETADSLEILSTLATYKIGMTATGGGLELISSIVDRGTQDAAKRADTGRPPEGYWCRVGIPFRPGPVRWEFERMGHKIPPAYVWDVPLLNSETMPKTTHRRTVVSERAFLTMHLSQFAIEKRTEYAERGIKLAEVIESGAEVYGFSAAHRSRLAETTTGQAKGTPDLYAPFQYVGDGRVRFSDYYSEAHQNILSAAGHSEKQKAKQKLGARRKRTKPR